MKQSEKITAGVLAGLVILAGGIGVFAANDDSNPSPSAAAATPAFSAEFETPSDFFGRFDYGFSGLFIPGTSIASYHGDHAIAPSPACGAPTTDRTVTLSAPSNTGTMDFSQAFWWCAPSGDASSGHVMTGITTTGYNHAWLAPKEEFSAISKVCWAINETTEYGKWTEVQFVSHADAIRYPVGTIIADGNAVARGTGGFDLGYTEPAFRPEATGGNSSVGPNNGLQPRGGTLAGLKVDLGGIFTWWQDQDTVVVPVNNGFAPGWPGPGNAANGGPGVTDKAVRYTTCIENVGSSQLLITNNRPDGVFTYTIDGAHIPQDSRRVVFHDAEYDGPKRPGYDPNRITWHWDNIQIFTAQGPPVTTTLPPGTTSTTVPITTSTVPPSTTTTSSTTTSSTTTVPPTTSTTSTTVLPTTTTVAVIPCPSTFNAAERRWCNQVNARLKALEG